MLEQKRPEIPVFRVKAEKSGVEKILHRNSSKGGQTGAVPETAPECPPQAPECTSGEGNMGHRPILTFCGGHSGA